jgi:hypothetical protein
MRSDTFKDLSSPNFWLAKMKEDLKKYIQLYPRCSQNILVRHKHSGLLPLLNLRIPQWHSIAKDLITNLSSRETCDQLWVIIARYIKIPHYSQLLKLKKMEKDLSIVFSRAICRPYSIAADITLIGTLSLS